MQQIPCQRIPSIVRSVFNLRMCHTLSVSIATSTSRLRLKFLCDWRMSTLSDDRWSISANNTDREEQIRIIFRVNIRFGRSICFFLFLSRNGEKTAFVSRKETTEERQRHSSVVMSVAGRSPHPPVWEFNLLLLRDSSEESVRRFLRQDLTGRPRRFARQFHGGYNRLIFFADGSSDEVNFFRCDLIRWKELSRWKYVEKFGRVLFVAV